MVIVCGDGDGACGDGVCSDGVCGDGVCSNVQINPLFKVELGHPVSNGTKNAVSVVGEYDVSLRVHSPAEV